MDLPIACSLTGEELKERRRTVLDAVRDAAIDVSPLKDGFAFRFEPRSELLLKLARLVDLERQCCPFLNFRIVVEANNPPISLEITGPPEARAIVSDLFSLSNIDKERRS